MDSVSFFKILSTISTCFLKPTSRTGSAFGVLGDVIETFSLSFLTGKLENLPDLAVFQRYSDKSTRQGKLCMCTCKCMFVCKCIACCVTKNTVVCGNGI